LGAIDFQYTVLFVRFKVWLSYQSDTVATVADPAFVPPLFVNLKVSPAVNAAKFVPSAYSTLDSVPAEETLERIFTLIVEFAFVVSVETPVIIPFRYPVNEEVDPAPGKVTADRATVTP
jgi:hypothetical protein